MNIKKIILYFFVVILFSVSVEAVVPGRTYFNERNNSFKYIIKAGDTLYNISRIFKIDLDKLKGLNYNLNPNSLQIGDQVLVSINEKLDYYVVGTGDSIWDISQERNYPYRYIIAYNRIENPAYVVPGEVIFLPEITVESKNIKVMEFEKKHGVIYISGVARVFEATINYALETKTGEVLNEGFTTALIGAPEWGKFEFRVIGIPDRAYYLTIFSVSARDGSRQDMVKLRL